MSASEDGHPNRSANARIVGRLRPSFSMMTNASMNARSLSHVLIILLFPCPLVNHKTPPEPKFIRRKDFIVNNAGPVRALVPPV